MLTNLREILPIGSYEWKLVFQCHEEIWNTGRDKDSIIGKFLTLHRKPIPTTGNPSLTPVIKLAKEMKHLIGVKANFGDGEEEFDLEEGYK